MILVSFENYPLLGLSKVISRETREMETVFFHRIPTLPPRLTVTFPLDLSFSLEISPFQIPRGEIRDDDDTKFSDTRCAVLTRNQCIGSVSPGFTRGVFQKPNIDGPLARRSRCEILSPFLVLPRLNIIVYEISSRGRYRDTGVERSSTSPHLSRSVTGNLFRAFQVFPKR